MFNVIDLHTGWKVDLIIRKSRPFSREEFRRRTSAEVEGVEVPVTAPEDLLIAKMEWARMGQSARQMEDAARMLRVRTDQLDWTYLEHWVRELQLEPQWREVRRAAGLAADARGGG